jgi:predicted transcriptional regulator YheO
LRGREPKRRKRSIPEDQTRRRDRDDDFIISRFSIVVDAIAKTFGSTCEVVLHDLRQLDKSVIKIEHGHITGRHIGSSITDLALKNLKKTMVNDVLINYPTTTKGGRNLKSTTVLIRNKKDIPIAALCINIDITNLQIADSIINELCLINTRKEEITETFEKDVESTINSIINNALAVHHIPLPIVQKEDRMKIVAKLDEQGVFLIKGALKIAANKLNVSKYAIYNYLDQIKRTDQKIYWE